MLLARLQAPGAHRRVGLSVEPELRGGTSRSVRCVGFGFERREDQIIDRAVGVVDGRVVHVKSIHQTLNCAASITALEISATDANV